MGKRLKIKFLFGLIVFSLISPAINAQDKNTHKTGTDSTMLKSGTDSTTLKTGTDSTTLKSGTDSTTLKTGTDSTMLKSGTDSTMLKTGTDSTMLKTGTDSTMLKTGTDSTTLQSGLKEESSDVNILFIVDASLSMKEKLAGGITKMEAAKKVLQDAMNKIPANVNLGLRVFGQSFSNIPNLDCRASALLVPVGQGNRRSIIERIRQIVPYGLTPLEYAIKQAATDDFSEVTGTKTLIVITDGAETCGGNPCGFVRSLPLMGIKIKIDVVGLDLKREPRARYQLNCISETSGGKYYDANSSDELVESVSNSVSKAITGKILPRSSK